MIQTGIDGLMTPDMGPTAREWWQGSSFTLPLARSYSASCASSAQPSNIVAPISAPCIGPHMSFQAIGGPA